MLEKLAQCHMELSTALRSEPKPPKPPFWCFNNRNIPFSLLLLQAVISSTWVATQFERGISQNTCFH